MFLPSSLLELPAICLGQAAAKSSFTDTLTSLLPLLLLIAAAVIAAALGRAISRSIRLPETGNRLAIIFGVLLISGLMIFSNWPPRFGVDLRGGINYVGQLDLSAFQSKAERQQGAPPPTAETIIPQLMRRVDPSGTREIVIRALDDDKIEVIMPQVDQAEADEIWNRLAKTGHLQFRIVAERTFHGTQMDLAAQQALSGNRSRSIYRANAKGEQQLIASWYDLAREDLEGVSRPDSIVPIKFVPSNGLHLVRNRENGQLIDMNGIPFRSGVEPGLTFAAWLDSKGIRYPQILLIEPQSDRYNVEGEHLSSVASDFDEVGRPCITFGLNGEGAKRMNALTSSNLPQPNGKYKLAIVLDDALHSAPEIESTISSRGQITGRFTQKEVKELKVNLDSGKISVALVKDPISKQYLESTLGAELKSKGILAIASSLGLVLVFMMFYYRAFAGTIACLALLLNLAVTVALIMAIKQPLTLTGLAGLVLTIGMSVDSNVLIFERIREELARGASLRVAIQNGFDRAFGTIFDSNVTTLLTAIILYVFGTDQLKGFAVSIIIGILTSMFTAIYVSRTFFDIFEKKRWLKSLVMSDLFPKFEWDFMKRFGIAAVTSLVLIGAGLAALFSLGSRVLDIDLRGGSTAQVSFVESTTRKDVESALAGGKIQFRGEPVDFIVSELQGADGSKGREFKIDSSLPSYDPKAGAEKWDELDVVLTNIFGTRLVQRKLSYDPAAIVVTQNGAAVANPPAGDASPAAGDVPAGNGSPAPAGNSDLRDFRINSGAAWVALPELDGGLLTIQDEQPALTDPAAAAATPAGQESPAPQTPAPQSPAGTDVPAAAQNPAAGSEATPAPQAPADAPAAGAGQDAGQTGAGADAGAGAIGAGTGVAQLFSATVPLKFDHPISAKSIRTQILEASVRQDRLVEESQIILSSPVTTDPKELANASLTDWNLTLETTNREDAPAILADWAGQFNNKPWFKTASEVGSQIASGARYKAFVALFASLLGIVIYVWIRFQNVAFGLAAVVALIHDVLVVIGAIALSHYLAGVFGFLMVDKFKISLQIVAAVLTIIGYSLNDTIVIFDRIREIRGKRLEMTNDMINRSVSQTLNRTILTSLTTLIVVVLLYFLGGPAIHGFAFAMVIGVVAGTYSTVFVASPILVWLMNRWGLNAELNAELESART